MTNDLKDMDLFWLTVLEVSIHHSEEGIGELGYLMVTSKLT